MQQLHPTIPAHFFVETYPVRCHSCGTSRLYFWSQS